MAGGKETPRQKMIGMMYLFLTALLALNVSKEILQAFIVINKGIEATNSNFNSKLAEQYLGFKAAYDKNPAKAQAYWDKAQLVRKKADEMTHYITELKGRLVANSELGDPNQFKNYIGKDRNKNDTLVSLSTLKKPDDYDSPTHLLIGSDPAKPSTGANTADELLKKLADLKKVLQNACSDNKALQKQFEETFTYKDEADAHGKVQPWAVYSFYHTPIAATIAILSKLQADVKNAESTAITHLAEAIDAKTIKINKLVAVVDVKSNYITVGDSLVANIYLAAIDTTKAPIIQVQGQNVDVKGGSGYLSRVQTTPGEQTWKGIIKFDTPDGVQDYPFEIPFKVSDAAAVLDAKAMNVFYMGLDNPLEVSAPGIDSDKLRLSTNNPGVSISPGSGPGKYIVRTAKGISVREVEVYVDATTLTGGNKRVGLKKFRLKSVPTPNPYFMGKRPDDSTIPLAAAKEGNNLMCELKDFVFEGVQYKITKFSMVIQLASGDKTINAQGPNLSSEMKDVLKGMRKGQYVTFKDIFAVGPDGTERKLPGLNFKTL